jgi:alpha-3'-ketoglucosidase
MAVPALAAKPAKDNTLTRREKREGWVLLFDGTLKDWTTNEKQPSKNQVEDGSINPYGCGHYMLVHKQEWSDFVLSLDFKVSKDCNSGVFLRTFPLDKDAQVGYNGIEVQVLDGSGTGYTDMGSLYDLVKPTKNAARPLGEWNHLVITCNDNQIDVELNGEKVNHMDLNQWDRKGKRLDGSDHKFTNIAWKDHPHHGYIGLQDHGSPCWYKNIKLKPLNPSAASRPSDR